MAWVTSGVHTPEGTSSPVRLGALNVDKSDRDMLGGWAAQESDRYNRVARLRIRAVQERVVETFADRANHDPLFESDAIEEFRMFLQGQGTSAEVRVEYIQKVVETLFRFPPASPRTLGRKRAREKWTGRGAARGEEDEIEEELEAARKADVRKRQQAWNTDRTTKLGADPQEARRHLKGELAAGLLRRHQLQEEGKDPSSPRVLLHDPGNRLPLLHLRRGKVPKQAYVPWSVQVVFTGRRCTRPWRSLIRHGDLIEHGGGGGERSE